MTHWICLIFTILTYGKGVSSTTVITVQTKNDCTRVMQTAISVPHVVARCVEVKK